MRPVRLALALTVLLSVIVPAATARRHGGGDGIEIRAVSYDADTGAVEVRMRWNRRELRREGDDAGHLVVLGSGRDGTVLVRDEPVALGKDHRTRHVIRLTADERALLDGRAVTVAATHKHDDDGGLYDRAHYDRALAGGPGVRSERVSAGDDCQGLEIGPGKNLSGCDLSGAQMEYMDLVGTYLNHTDLSNADLFFANLSYAIVIYADLSHTDLRDAYLNHAEMTSANLTGAKLWYADLRDADLRYTNLKDANLHNARLDNADLSGAAFCNTVMPDDTVNNASCQGVPDGR